MKSFVKMLGAILSYKKSAIGFWVVWVLLVPFVFFRFLISDLVNFRFRHPTARVKTSLVRLSVYDQMVKGKG